ncbi:MAG: restriction endonuclease subunit S [Chloroflexota bacterium]
MPITVSEHNVYKQATLLPYPHGVVLKGVKRGFDFPHKQQRLIHSGQFLISKMHANRKIWGIVPPELDGAVVAKGYLSFDIRPALNHEYFAAYLSTKLFGQASFAACTMYGRLIVQQFAGISMPLPSTEDQFRIAEVWRHTHSALEHTAEMFSSISDIRSGVIQDWFQKKNSSWEHCTLRDYAEIGPNLSSDFGLTVLAPDKIILGKSDPDVQGIGIVPTDEVDNRFLYYFLESQKQTLLEAVSGTRYDLKTILQNLPIPLPTLYEQRKFVGLMETHDEALLALRKEQTALHKLVQGMLDGIFSGTLNLQDVLQTL